MTSLGTFWMLVSKGGGVVVRAAPAETRNKAWKNARRELGAATCLMLRRQGYTAQRVTLSLDGWTWRERGIAH